MHRLCVVVFLWLVGLHGPALAQPEHKPSAEEILVDAVKFNPDVWQSREDGGIRHIVSGFTCSAQLANVSIVRVVSVPDGVVCLWMDGPELRMVTGAKQAEFGELLEDVGRKAMSVLNVTQPNTDDPVVNYDFNGCPAVRVVAMRDGWKADLILARKGSYYWVFGASAYDRDAESRRRLAEVLAAIDEKFKSEISCKASG
ncbi:MAG: hypothetical protein QM773_03055 [Hyphomonadaceae bacterium]